MAGESLRGLPEDSKVPHGVWEALAADYREIKSMLEHGHLHIAVFGRVSVGKSALLNALLGEQRFATRPLHGETKFANHAA
jgi:GTP-binding protein Era